VNVTRLYSAIIDSAFIGGRLWRASRSRRGYASGILGAPDRDELLNWLRHQPLMHHDATLGFTMAHAGLAPAWNLAKPHPCKRSGKRFAERERGEFFHHMYGNRPDLLAR